MTEETKPEVSLEEDIAELAQILTDDPSMEHKIRETIEYHFHLEEGIVDETFGKMRDSLDILVGMKASRLILKSCVFNKGEFFEHIKAKIEGESLDKSLPFLQYITALYGNEIEKAYTIFLEEPNDWMVARASAFSKRGEEGKEFVELDLIKINGEKVYLRMPLESALQLASRLLREIGRMPQEAIEAINEEIIKRFNEEAKVFQQKFLGKSSNED